LYPIFIVAPQEVRRPSSNGALIAALFIARPKGNLLRESLRILTDLVRLLKNLTTDSTLPAASGYGWAC